MALIKLGALAQDVRGSLNGTTFSRNKGGAYVRTKVSPVQPVSDFSANSRQAFKVVSQAWAALLTDADRADWIAFANLHPFINVFGDSINLSGVAFYQAAMKRLQQIGFPIFDVPPVTWDVVAPGAIAPVVSLDGAGNISVLINPTTPPTSGDITAYLFMTKALAPGAQPQKTDYRLINDFTGTVRDNTYDFGAAYKARFTPYLPAVGSKLALLYAYLDTTDGAISVVSGETVLAVGVPGPLVQLAGFSATDQGAGNVTRFWNTATPHGLATGQSVTVICSPANAEFDVTALVITVDSPTSFKDPAPVVGGVVGYTPHAGTVQRVA